MLNVPHSYHRGQFKKTVQQKRVSTESEFNFKMDYFFEKTFYESTIYTNHQPVKSSTLFPASLFRVFIAPSTCFVAILNRIQVLILETKSVSELESGISTFH